MAKTASALGLSLVLGLAGSTGAAVDARNRHSQGVRESPLISHVFIIVLENEGFDKTFGTSSDAPFLSKTLTKRGRCRDAIS